MNTLVTGRFTATFKHAGQQYVKNAEQGVAIPSAAAQLWTAAGWFAADPSLDIADCIEYPNIVVDMNTVFNSTGKRVLDNPVEPGDE